MTSHLSFARDQRGFTGAERALLTCLALGLGAGVASQVSGGSGQAGEDARRSLLSGLSGGSGATLKVGGSIRAIHAGQAAADHTVPLPRDTIPVPLYHQKENYSCGAASTLAILRYWKTADYQHTREAALYGPLHTTKDGTDPQPIAAFLDQVPGLHAEYRSGKSVTLDDLQQAVDRGEPPIVDLQAWHDPKVPYKWASDWDDGHYVVLVAYDQDRLYFMDPDTAGHYTYIPRTEFLDRWHDVVGEANVHTDHLAIFVHGTTPPFKPNGPLPDRVSLMK